MRFSVIVHIHNGAAALAGTVSSVLNQACRDMEVLLVDDGSADDSAMLCDGYAHAFPQLVRVLHRGTGSRGASRNMGIEASGGDFLLFLECGDELDPSALACLSQRIDEVRADGYLFGCLELQPDRANPDRNRIQTGVEVYHLAEHPNQFPLHPDVHLGLWKRELFLDSGLRFGKGVWYEDFLTGAKLLRLCHGVAMVPDRLYIRRKLVPQEIQSQRRTRELMDALDELRRYFRVAGLEEACGGWITAVAVEQVLRAAKRIFRSREDKQMLRSLAVYLNNHFPGYETEPLLPRPKEARMLKNGRFFLLGAALAREKV